MTSLSYAEWYAESILTHHRAEECDANLMPFREIIRLIPEEE